MKVRRTVVVELTAAEVIEACRRYALTTIPRDLPRDPFLVTADGFDDHDRVFSLTFEDAS